jgi:low affinity Fe/Cu permease
MRKAFHHFASTIARASGHWLTFIAALAVVVAWLVSGPLLQFSELWQLSINTATTIVTFLMVFLIQHSQNADTKAMQKKLDELITHLEGPRDEVAGIEQHDE